MKPRQLQKDKTQIVAEPHVYDGIYDNNEYGNRRSDYTPLTQVQPTSN